ncbi:SCO5918 family protein [Streptomyces sp. NBC_00536]|uniref:SCO5918 family protein n=1 Tax=Streptomyces sp. NBC_00536 TaxID=2975769 RepID=UPI002E80A3D9|nr:SCO5918 family protein [Streptomyces sp. NBC_00536]WUC77159.1 SCO5918 family protein [Streptomyces sp. NBC_00536]
MRCVIARFPFELTKSGVLASMKGVKPEPVTGESAIIGRRTYPVKQVGAVITRQDRRDFSAAEVTRALSALGFTCRAAAAPAEAAVPGLTQVERASVLLGATAGV